MFTKNQCILLINMVNASVERASTSGIPIHQEYYNDIDEIKNKLYQELSLKNREG